MGLIAEAAKQRGSIFSSAAPAPTPQAQPQGGGGFSPLGFFGNFVGDFTDLAKGLTSLGGIAIGDVIHGATLGKVGEEFRSDDLIRGLPGAVASDYASRYGSPSKFARSLYEHPGSFLLDLLGAGQLAGKGAVLAAKAAPVAEGVQALRAGTMAREAAPMGIRAVESILPKTKPVLSNTAGPLAKIEQVTERANPVTRVLFDRPLERLTTEPLGVLERKAGLATETAKLPGANVAQQTEAKMLADLVERARDAGLTRIPRQTTSDRQMRRAFDRIYGANSSETLRLREDQLSAIRRIWKPVYDAGLDTVAHGYLQRLDFDLPGRGAHLTPGFRPSKAIPARAAKGGGAVTDIVERVRMLSSKSVLGRTMEEFRSFWEESVLKPLYERGDLTSEIAAERAYLPLRKKYGAKFNYDLGEFEGGPNVDELRQALHAAGEPEPVYFPHLDERRAPKLSDFWKRPEPIGGRIGPSHPGYLKKSTGYLLEKGRYVKDPIEATSRHAAAVTTNMAALRLFDKLLETFSIKISAADAVPAGWALVAPDHFRRLFRGTIKYEDELHDILSAGTSLDEANASALKASMVPLQDEIARQFVGVAPTQLYAVPQAVMDRWLQHVKPAFGSPSIERAIRRYWDTPMNVWKGAVLAGSPRWIVNNVLGNTVFLKMQGARTRDMIAFLEQRFVRMLNQKLDTKFDTSLIEALDKLPGINEARGGMFRLDEQYTPHLGAAAQGKTGQAIEAVAASKPAHGLRRAGQGMRRLNSIVEDAAREASYLKALERQQALKGIGQGGRRFMSTKAKLDRIARDGFTEAQAKTALDDLNHWMNDYKKSGPLERKYLRRFIAPFWSFYKHTAKLLLSYPIDYPARAELLKAITDTSNEIVAEAQGGPVPAFLEGLLPLGTGPEGETQFLNTRSANPFSGLAQSPIGMLAPPLKVGLEQLQGRNVYTGREFSDPNVVKPFGSSQRYRVDAEGGTATPVEQVRPGILEHLLRQFPQYQLAEDLIAGGDTYDTANIGSIIADRLGADTRAIRAEPGGAPKYPFDPLQQLLRFSGVSTTDYDLGAFRERLTEEQIAALTYFLRQLGRLP